jgi:hypothetical protein
MPAYSKKELVISIGLTLLYQNLSTMKLTAGVLVALCLMTVSPTFAQQVYWDLTGNTATTPGTHFIGTTDNQLLVFKTNNAERATILANGNTLIGGTTDNGQKFQVNGTVRFEDLLSVIKPYVADAKVLEVGRSPNVNSNVTVVYGNTQDFITLNVGSTLALKRNGGGDPSISSSQSALTLLANNYIDFQTNGGAPASIRLRGNFGLGSPVFGAYNPAPAMLTIGNSYNNYEFLHHTRFKNGTIQIVNLAGNVVSILNESGNLGLGVSNPSAQLHTTGTVRFAGLANDNALTRVLATDANGNVSWRDASTLGGSAANAWTYGGNSVSSTATIGNTSAHDLQIITNNTARITIDGSSGNVGIGTTNIEDASYKLFVEGNIRTRKVRVDADNWADFVFDPGYRLRPLREVEQFIQTHKHLPDVPSAIEVKKEGIDLGENQAVLLRKIEELTLYIIEQNKRIEELEKQLKNRQ